jgi:hypothetical protein
MPRGTSGEPKRGTHKILYLGLFASAALAVSALSLKALPMPFVWIGLTWAGAITGALFCLHGTRPRWSLSCLHGTWLRAILFNVSVAAVAFAAVEAYLSLHESTADTERIGRAFYVEDDVLGTVPAKGVRVQAASRSYNVTYTIDSNGLRIAPPVQKDQHAGCILFFGCSMTFGEGLQDNETLPYQVGIQSGGQYRTFNFAFEGYGPHQMLAAIEQGRVRRVVDCSPQYAIYVAITDHVRRAAGKVPYGKHAPRYLLDPGGAVRRVGNFEQAERAPSPLEAELRWQFGKSAIYRRLANRASSVSEDDVHRMLAIVRRSRDLLAAEYPGIKFHVILWPDWNKDGVIHRELQDGFRQLNIPVHLVEDILPDHSLASTKYVLSSHDNHPNALADRLLANYVLTKIVPPQSGACICSR